MATHDYLEVEEAVQKEPDGASLPAGDYEIRGLSGIEAYYKISDLTLSVVDNGDFEGEADNLIMAEAPLHYSVMSGRFNGSIHVDGKNLVIADNVVVGVISNV